MTVDEFVEDCRCLIENGMNVTEDLEKALSIIERQMKALKRIAVDECGCGVPCDCYSWAGLAAIAREELARGV